MRKVQLEKPVDAPRPSADLALEDGRILFLQPIHIVLERLGDSSESLSGT
jgi:hypothetical protein